MAGLDFMFDDLSDWFHMEISARRVSVRQFIPTGDTDGQGQNVEHAYLCVVFGYYRMLESYFYRVYIFYIYIASYIFILGFSSSFLCLPM